jgi:hypothetical protein
MNIDNALPGHLVASVFEVLFVDAGYQIIPTGIERTLRELRTVSLDTYIDLVPQRLRSEPDFFILDLNVHQSWMTEIKFRHYLHPALCDDLRVMHREWAPFHLILALAEPPIEWTGIVRHIKVFTIKPETRLDEEFFRTRGTRLQDVFPRLGKRWGDGTIQKAQDAILRITAREDIPSPWSPQS